MLFFERCSHDLDNILLENLGDTRTLQAVFEIEALVLNGKVVHPNVNLMSNGNVDVWLLSPPTPPKKKNSHQMRGSYEGSYSLHP